MCFRKAQGRRIDLQVNPRHLWVRFGFPDGIEKPLEVERVGPEGVFLREAVLQRALELDLDERGFLSTGFGSSWEKSRAMTAGKSIDEYSMRLL